MSNGELTVVNTRQTGGSHYGIPSMNSYRWSYRVSRGERGPDSSRRRVPRQRQKARRSRAGNPPMVSSTDLQFLPTLSRACAVAAAGTP